MLQQPGIRLDIQNERGFTVIDLASRSIMYCWWSILSSKGGRFYEIRQLLLQAAPDKERAELPNNNINNEMRVIS